MGVDKLQLKIGVGGCADRNHLPPHPTSVLERVVNVCATVADEVMLLQAPTDAAQAYTGPLAAGRGSKLRTQRIHVVPDRDAHRGPLSALAHAWDALTVAGVSSSDADLQQYIWVVAGDLIGLTTTVLETCRKHLAAGCSNTDGAVVTRAGTWQPLCGCYRWRVGSALQAALTAGETRLMKVVDQLQLVPVSAQAYGWPDWWTRPLHTPADYRDWLQHQRAPLKDEGENT